MNESLLARLRFGLVNSVARSGVFICLLTFLLALPVEVAAADLTLGRSAIKLKRYDRALEIFDELSQKGIGEANFALGYLYINGLGVPADRSKGIKYMRKAAEQGYMEAASVICDYEFQDALRSNDFRRVVDACIPPASYTGAFSRYGEMDVSRPLQFNSLFPSLSRFRLGVAYDSLGEQNYALICYVSSYIQLEDSVYSSELHFMEKRAAVWNLLGHAKVELPGKLPDWDETAPGCLNTRRYIVLNNWETIGRMVLRGSMQ